MALKAEATDDSSGVAEVYFYVYKNGAWSWVGADDTAGGTSGNEYSVSWDSTSVPDWQGYFSYAAARDLAVNDNTSPGAYNFYVENTVAPTIQDRSPVSGKTGVRRGSDVSVAFSEAMNVGTLNPSNVVLRKNGTGPPVPAVVNSRQNGWAVEIDPSSRLSATTRYMVTPRRDSSETGVQDEAGNLLDGLGKYVLSGDQRYVYFWFKTGRR